MFYLGQMATILDVLLTMQCPKYFVATSLGRAYIKHVKPYSRHKNHESYFVEDYIRGTGPG